MIWNLLLEAAEGGAGKEEGNGTGTIIMLIIFAVALVGMFIWQSISNKKKQKEAQQMVEGIKIGDKVKTIGGICGYVAQIDNNENTFVLETGMEGKTSFVKFDKAAIYQTAPANAPVQTKKEEPKKEEPKAEVKAEVKEEKPEVVEEKVEETKDAE